MNYINPKKFYFAVLFLSVFISSILAYTDNAKKNISDSVLRLHIIANSDSEYDQSLKLKVRDRIISDAGELFSNTKSPEDTAFEVKNHLELLENSARDELLKNNSFSDVNIEVGNFFFPQKRYGGLFLPAGNYNAVRVLIGEGKGKNWWCVMFPPLCFTRGVVEIPDDSDAYLKDTLTDGEYSLITDKTMPEVELRFKILDLFSSRRKD